MSDERRHALVTGANRGLGLHLSAALVRRGWSVIGACRRPDAADELRRCGATAVVPFDAADPDGAVGSLTASLAELGVTALDLCVHNAGIKPAEHDPDRRASFLDGLDTRVWRDVLDVNLVAPMRATQALLPWQEAAPGRSVLALMSSNLGSNARVVGDDLTYSCSKAALNMAANLLGSHLAERGVDVVAVTPGWVRTDMGGPSAPLDPEETMDRLATTLDVLDPSLAGRLVDVDGRTVAW